MENTVMKSNQTNGMDVDEKMEAEVESDYEDENSSVSDSVDDDKQEEELIRKKEELIKQLQVDKTDYAAYVDLINVYRNLGDLDGLRQIHEQFHQEYPLSWKIWMKWIEDEKKMAVTPEEKQRVIELYERALKDYQSVDIWLDYVASSFSLVSENGTFEVSRSILERAINKCGCHVVKAASIWGLYRDIENNVLQELKLCPESEETREKIRGLRLKIMNLFQRELALPLQNAEETYSEFKTWLESENASDEFDLEQLELNYHKALQTLSQILPFEEKLISVKPESKESLEAYKEYLNFEKNSEKGENDPKRVISLYERAVIDHPISSDLWSDFLKYVLKLNVVPEDKEEVCYRALRNCPSEVKFWCQYLLFLERRGTPKHEIMRIFNKSKEQSIQSAHDYRSLWFSYVYYLRRQLSTVQSNSDAWLTAVDEIRKTLAEAYEEVIKYFGFNGDPGCELSLWWARFEAEIVNDLPRFREIWSDILESGLNERASYWLRYITMEWQYGDAKHMRKYCSKALEKVTDSPEPITKLWLEYESLNGSLDSFSRCQNICEEKLKKYKEEDRKRKEKSGQTKNKSPAIKVDKKKVKENVKSKPKSNDKQEEKGKWSHLTKPEKKVEPKPESATAPVAHDPSKDDQTIFISNLDFTVTEEEVRNILGKIGRILEFRLVRDFKGRSKGFGYLVFSSKQEAEASLKLDRTPINLRPMFVSKCDVNKQSRQTGLRFKIGLEKNKLFVKNLPVTLDKAAVEKIFNPYGSLSDVRIVTYRNGHSKGLAFIEYENEESAAHALLKTDGIEIEGKPISVAISNPPERKNNPLLLAATGEPVNSALGGGNVTKSSFGLRGRGRTQLSFIPSQVGKPSTSGTGEQMDTSEPEPNVFKKPMSNVDFKNFLLKK